MTKIFFILFSILCLKANCQNIIKIANDSQLVFLAKVDSITKTENYNFAYLKNVNSNERKLLKFKPQSDYFGYKTEEYQINKNDTILVFAEIKNDTIVNKLAINKNQKELYNIILQFNKVKSEVNYKKRLDNLKKWIITATKHKDFKPYLTKIIRNDNERNYFFNLVNITESDLKFNKKEKKTLKHELINEKCLKFENFYIVYLMRYSYDQDFEGLIKPILYNYCLPFGDGHLQMMETILYNKKSDELKGIYSKFQKTYYGNLNEAKKIYNEFINKI
jgi:hypothetical protein